MTIDTNPYRSLNADISPEDFEIFCMKTLEAYAKKEKLQDVTIKHNQKIETYDGTYQIDVFVEYTALGTRNVVLVECKKQARNVERDEVSNLYDKVKSVGAQKGILISTAGFQTGAVQYAQKHGVALWQIFDECIKRMAMSTNSDVLHIMGIQISRYLPKYLMMEWDCSEDFPYTQIYPTEEMRKAAIEKVKEDFYA